MYRCTDSHSASFYNNCFKTSRKFRRIPTKLDEFVKQSISRKNSSQNSQKPPRNERKTPAKVRRSSPNRNFRVFSSHFRLVFVVFGCCCVGRVCLLAQFEIQYNTKPFISPLSSPSPSFFTLLESLNENGELHVLF